MDTRTLLEQVYGLDAQAVLAAEGLSVPGIEGEAVVAADPSGDLLDRPVGVALRIHAEGRSVNPISALADTGEDIIAESLDGLAMAAGQRLVIDHKGWHSGHEGIGPTGPYAPRDPRLHLIPDAQSHEA